MRWALVVLLTVCAGCNDLRDFRGDWRGSRVGTAPSLQTGTTATGEASLAIDRVDQRGLAARLTIAGLVPETAIASIEGAEADALAGMTFSGAPLRVYLAFAAVPDGGGDALVIVALYEDRRVEVRVLRGGSKALYGIFALAEAEPA